MDNQVVKPGKFQVPSNFSEEPAVKDTEPWLEDLENDHTELYIMQIPSSVDLSQIRGKSLDLQGPTCFEYEGQFGNILKSVATSYDSDEGTPYHLIVPGKSDGKLHVVRKPFAGHILFSEYFAIPESKVPVISFDERADKPKDAKQRFVPFGSSQVDCLNQQSLRKSKAKKKKISSKRSSGVSVRFSSSDSENALDSSTCTVANSSPKASKNRIVQGDNESHGIDSVAIKQEVVDREEDNISQAGVVKKKKSVQAKPFDHSDTTGVETSSQLQFMSDGHLENSHTSTTQKKKRAKDSSPDVSFIKCMSGSTSNHNDVEHRPIKLEHMDYSSDGISPSKLHNSEKAGEYIMSLDKDSSKKKKKHRRVKDEPLDIEENAIKIEPVDLDCSFDSDATTVKNVEVRSQKKKKKKHVSIKQEMFSD